MYSFVKPLLFKLDPEHAHDIAMSKLQKISAIPFASRQVERMFGAKVPDLPTQCMGLQFRHPVGLAAGLDKDARALPAFSALGFSGVELGTVTPKPQSGNDKPRMFRLVEDEAMALIAVVSRSFLRTSRKPKPPELPGSTSARMRLPRLKMPISTMSLPCNVCMPRLTTLRSIFHHPIPSHCEICKTRHFWTSC